MPKKREHSEHSQKRHPGIAKEIHDMVHGWMDHPSNWEIGTPYESGFQRKKGYGGRNHRNIRHDPEKVANALSGGNPDKWEKIKKIAKAHTDLDGITTPNLKQRFLNEREYKERFKPTKPEKIITNVTSSIKTSGFFKKVKNKLKIKL